MNEKTKNWIELAKRDLALAKELKDLRNFRSYAPHYCHQALEKIIKGLVVYRAKITPPYIHNLVRLAHLAKIELDKNHQDILASLNPHYIGTKYPEDIAKMFKLYTQAKVDEIYSQTRKVFQWLKKLIK